VLLPHAAYQQGAAIHHQTVEGSLSVVWLVQHHHGHTRCSWRDHLSGIYFAVLAEEAAHPRAIHARREVAHNDYDPEGRLTLLRTSLHSDGTSSLTIYIGSLQPFSNYLAKKKQSSQVVCAKLAFLIEWIFLIFLQF
jgi:hypothetical protein